MQKLSSLNIILSIIYVLVYLKNGTFHSTLGILMIIVFNWLALRSFQLEYFRFSIWHYLIALWVIYFIGMLVYGWLNILTTCIAYNFISGDTLRYLIINFIFCATISLQVVLYAIKFYKQSKHISY